MVKVLKIAKVIKNKYITRSMKETYLLVP